MFKAGTSFEKKLINKTGRRTLPELPDLILKNENQVMDSRGY